MYQKDYENLERNLENEVFRLGERNKIEAYERNKENILWIKENFPKERINLHHIDLEDNEYELWDYVIPLPYRKHQELHRRISLTACEEFEKLCSCKELRAILVGKKRLDRLETKNFISLIDTFLEKTEEFKQIKNRKYHNEYNNRPEVVDKRKELYEKNRAYKLEQAKEYRNRPEVKERKKAYDKEYDRKRQLEIEKKRGFKSYGSSDKK